MGRINKLKLCPDKMELLLIEPNSILEGETLLVLDGDVLPSKVQLCNLEVVSDLAWLLDVQVVVVTYCLLRLICLDKRNFTTIIHATVVSKLN